MERYTLRQRSLLNPTQQRELFVKENMNSQDNVENFNQCENKDLIVVSFNTYYSRVRNLKTMKEQINIKKTMEMIDKLIENGVDIVLLQEVVFADTYKTYGSDKYSYDFFSSDNFEHNGEYLEKFVNDKGWVLIKGIPSNSSMYRHKFGNAVILNPHSLVKKNINILGSNVIKTLAKKIPEDHEGRSAIFVNLKNLKSNKSFTVVCTHLTEKQIDGNGSRQTQMIKKILDHIKDKKNVIIGGDMNVNQIDKLPKDLRDFCMTNKFLKVDTNPYVVLKEVGFVNHKELVTVWNGIAVDYLGSRVAPAQMASRVAPVQMASRVALMVKSGVLSNIIGSYSVSDHMIPWGCFDVS